MDNEWHTPPLRERAQIQKAIHDATEAGGFFAMTETNVIFSIEICGAESLADFCNLVNATAKLSGGFVLFVKKGFKFV